MSLKITRRELLKGAGNTALGSVLAQIVPAGFIPPAEEAAEKETAKHCDCPSDGWAVGGWCIPWNIAPPPHKVYLPIALD